MQWKENVNERHSLNLRLINIIMILRLGMSLGRTAVGTEQIYFLQFQWGLYLFLIVFILFIVLILFVPNEICKPILCDWGIITYMCICVQKFYLCTTLRLFLLIRLFYFSLDFFVYWVIFSFNRFSCRCTLVYFIQLLC